MAMHADGVRQLGSKLAVCVTHVCGCVPPSSAMHPTQSGDDIGVCVCKCVWNS